MRVIILVVLVFASIKSYGQIIEMPLPVKAVKQEVQFPPGKNKDGTFKFDNHSYEKEAKMQVWPNQKIKFEIKSPGHQVFIGDTLGNVLFKQKTGKGYYTVTTDNFYRYFIVYDLDKLRHKNVVGYDPINDFKRSIIFGKDKQIDAVVTMSAININ